MATHFEPFVELLPTGSRKAVCEQSLLSCPGTPELKDVPHAAGPAPFTLGAPQGRDTREDFGLRSMECSTRRPQYGTTPFLPTDHTCASTSMRPAQPGPEASWTQFGGAASITSVAPQNVFNDSITSASESPDVWFPATPPGLKFGQVIPADLMLAAKALPSLPPPLTLPPARALTKRTSAWSSDDEE